MPLLPSEVPTEQGIAAPFVRSLLLLPDRNTDGSDWSKAFRPEAQRCAALHHIPPECVVQIDVGQDHIKRSRPVLDALARQQDLAFLASLCHGWMAGIQLGFTTRTAPVLARAIRAVSRPDIAVALYACSSGDGQHDAGVPGGEGGFADALRDALMAEGMTDAHVDAHTLAGPTCTNPYVRRFSSATAQGGEWIIEPNRDVEKAWARMRIKLKGQGKGTDSITPALLLQEMGGSWGPGELWARWRFALRDTDLRFRFPLLGIDAIRAEVAGLSVV